MTTNGVPADPIVNPSTQVPLGDVTAFMQGPMPVPSEGERQGAIAATTEVAPPPLETPVQQPHIQEPTPIQPGIEQPVLPTQPAPAQPQPIAPQPTQSAPADWQQQIDTLNNRIQERETVFAQQQQDLDAQQERNNTQQIVGQAQDHARGKYQQYMQGGVTEEQARAWAMNDYQFAGNAYTYQAQQSQATLQAQTIAKQHGINVSDIPTGLPEQAMQKFASMQAQLNRLGGQTQTVQQNQIATQTFDSGQGTAPANATEQFINQLGDPTKSATPQQLLAMDVFMKQQLGSRF